MTGAMGRRLLEGCGGSVSRDRDGPAGGLLSTLLGSIVVLIEREEGVLEIPLV